MPNFEKFSRIASNMNLLERHPILHNQLPRLYDLASSGGTMIAATVHSTGEAEPASGIVRAIEDSQGGHWFMGPLHRYELYAPGQGDGVFAGHSVSVGGIQLRVDEGSFNIQFPVAQTVQGNVLDRTVVGTGPDGTEYAVTLSAVPAIK